MRRLLAATLAIAAAPLVAQQMPKEAPGRPDPALATSGRYVVDGPHTQAMFTVSHLGFTHYTGQFTNATGSLVLDAKAPANSKVDVSFPIDKIRTTVGDLDTELIGGKYFDAGRFPTAHFVSTRIARTGTGTATMTGNLTIKGVTRPVVFQVRLVGAGQEFWGAKKAAIGFTATTSINRSDFGLGEGVPLVSDKVDLVINAGFEAA